MLVQTGIQTRAARRRASCAEIPREGSFDDLTGMTRQQDHKSKFLTRRYSPPAAVCVCVCVGVCVCCVTHVCDAAYYALNLCRYKHRIDREDRDLDESGRSHGRHGGGKTEKWYFTLFLLSTCNVNTYSPHCLIAATAAKKRFWTRKRCLTLIA